ncbi:MAG: hypothetical protein ACLPQY_07015 [Streptosporangiaceae bacterium]
MKTYQPKHAQIGSAEGLAEVSRADPPRRAARGMLILALVLGGVGAEGAAISGHGTGDQASTHHAASGKRPVASAYLTSSGHMKVNPYMW